MHGGADVTIGLTDPLPFRHSVAGLDEGFGDGADVLAQWHHEPFRQYPGCNGPLVGFGFMADGLEPAVERKQAAHAAARFAGWRTPETGLG